MWVMTRPESEGVNPPQKSNNKLICLITALALRFLTKDYAGSLVTRHENDCISSLQIACVTQNEANGNLTKTKNHQLENREAPFFVFFVITKKRLAKGFLFFLRANCSQFCVRNCEQQYLRRANLNASNKCIRVIRFANRLM